MTYNVTSTNKSIKKMILFFKQDMINALVHAVVPILTVLQNSETKTFETKLYQFQLQNFFI